MVIHSQLYYDDASMARCEIRDRERETILSLETTLVTRLERINSAMEEVQSLVKQMNQAVDFTSNLIQRSSSSDVMRNKETLTQRFEVLRKTKVLKHGETSSNLPLLLQRT